MTELLHAKNFPESPQPADTPHEVLQQVNMEDEFALELNLLKNNQCNPRPEAINSLLQLIHDQTVVEH